MISWKLLRWFNRRNMIKRTNSTYMIETLKEQNDLLKKRVETLEATAIEIINLVRELGRRNGLSMEKTKKPTTEYEWKETKPHAQK